MSRSRGRLRARLDALSRARPVVRARRAIDWALPRSFQGRLTVSVGMLMIVVLLTVSGIVYNRMDAYLGDQDRQALTTRATEVASLIRIFAVILSPTEPIVYSGNLLNREVASSLGDSSIVAFLTDTVAQADLVVRIGGASPTADGQVLLSPSDGGTITGLLHEPASPREAREQLSVTVTSDPFQRPGILEEKWGVEVTLSDPYTTRASTLNAIVGLLFVTVAGALVLSLAIAALVARRFTRPLQRLTEAARGLGGGDLTRRVPAGDAGRVYSEAAELAGQFNLMAAQLEDSVEIIRSDRDRSREFLADVSHELRTPIAALRTFVELLQTGADDDPAAREEFLDASQVQLARLDWLAQNLLELSKLDSGLLALDLRPEDLRATVESAVEQAEAAAKRRNVVLAVDLPAAAVRVRHDPPRIGQVVSNLVGNSLKFTPRGGRIQVILRAVPAGAEIEVSDTGVGIAPDELPHVFERFFRGAQAHEARGSGSGLGLAIVKSIVDMHAGRVTVESAVGVGTTFVVTLPADPRESAPASADRTTGASPAARQARSSGTDGTALPPAGAASRAEVTNGGRTPPAIASEAPGEAPAGSGREVVNS